LFKETAGAFAGARTHDRHITWQAHALKVIQFTYIYREANLTNDTESGVEETALHWVHVDKYATEWETIY